jgi:hypothetical protein
VWIWDTCRPEPSSIDHGDDSQSVALLAAFPARGLYPPVGPERRRVVRSARIAAVGVVLLCGSYVGMLLVLAGLLERKTAPATAKTATAAMATQMSGLR